MQLRRLTIVATAIAYLALAFWAQTRPHGGTQSVGLGLECKTFEYGWPILSAERHIEETYDRNAWQWGGSENRQTRHDETVFLPLGLTLNLVSNFIVALLLSISLSAVMGLAGGFKYSILDIFGAVLFFAVAISLITTVEYPNWKTRNSLSLNIQWWIAVASISSGVGVCFNYMITKRIGKFAR